MSTSNMIARLKQLTKVKFKAEDQVIIIRFINFKIEFIKIIKTNLKIGWMETLLNSNSLNKVSLYIKLLINQLKKIYKMK